MSWIKLTSVLSYLATISHCTSSAFQFILEVGEPGLIQQFPFSSSGCKQTAGEKEETEYAKLMLTPNTFSSSNHVQVRGFLKSLQFSCCLVNHKRCFSKGVFKDYFSYFLKVRKKRSFFVLYSFRYKTAFLEYKYNCEQSKCNTACIRSKKNYCV